MFLKYNTENNTKQFEYLSENKENRLIESNTNTVYTGVLDFNIPENIPNLDVNLKSGRLLTINGKRFLGTSDQMDPIYKYIAGDKQFNLNNDAINQRYNRSYGSVSFMGK